MLSLGYLQATHNRAGEIIYTQIGELSIRATIITYTKTSAVDADRDSLELFWGDGTSEFILRSNGDGNGIELEGDIKYNIYVSEHTYPGRGTYTMWFEDPNRVANILNVNAPNSVDIPFYVETSFTFLNTQFQGSNSSVQLLKEPIDFACVGKRFIHNPNAFDVDGDSISYELIAPRQSVDEEVPKYRYPDEIVPGIFNQISLDPISGDFVWEAPQIVGEYNIAIKINEYRNGVQIGYVVRDMQIFVSDCENDPPTIESIDEICVIAGERISIPIIADDIDQMQQISISATGGPFEVDSSKAFLSTGTEYQDPAVNFTFEWQTTCDHISEQYYQVVIRAVDDFFQFQNSGLAELKTIRIKVVGPAPENLQTETNSEGIKLSWDAPYACEDASDDYFQGFSVWRKVKSNQFEIDTCTPGLEGQGYQKIVFITNELENGRYIYFDNEIEKGQTYCYRVLGEFARITNAGFPYNPVESLPSNEACGILQRDIPLITHVSVLETDQNNGQIEIKWVKPKIPDLDTLLFPGPYRYQLLRGEGVDPIDFSPVPGADFTGQFFQSPIDTQFIDSGINTLNNAYSYRVAFYTSNNPDPFGISSNASSVFLSTIPNDQLIDLDWIENVPWDNYNYRVFRSIGNSENFELIDSTNNQIYRDQSLNNGQLYCYFIESEGTYGLADIEDPLFNRSQIICSVPQDSMPPCIPILNVINVCDDTDLVTSDGLFINLLSWEEIEEGCLTDSDVAVFNIYTSNDSTNFELLASIDINEEFRYEDIVEQSVIACYAITAIDSSGNESAFSEIVCTDNCPLYELPNVFTPNGDGFNDIFVPTKNRFVDEIEIKVFNRWGQLVFETTDPEINWDGKNFNGNDLAEGVYFYNCVIKENIIGSDTNIITGRINGTIQIIRTN